MEQDFKTCHTLLGTPSSGVYNCVNEHQHYIYSKTLCHSYDFHSLGRQSNNYPPIGNAISFGDFVNLYNHFICCNLVTETGT